MMTNYRIGIKSDTGSLTLSHYSVCRILDGGMSGFDLPDIDVKFTNNAFADGGFITERHFAPRVLSVYFEVTDRTKYPEIRDGIFKLMNPHGSAKITTYMYGRRRVITGVPCGVPQFTLDNFGDIPRVKLSFLCEDPFFYEERELKITLPNHTPLFTFPLNLMGEAGTAVSYREDGAECHSVYNPGDVECGFTATIYAAYGDVARPYISMNGERLQLLETLKMGDTLVFETVRGNKKITVNGVIKYNFGKNNKFFGLKPGENKLCVSSNDGADALVCDLKFTPLYLGA